MADDSQCQSGSAQALTAAKRSCSGTPRPCSCNAKENYLQEGEELPSYRRLMFPLCWTLFFTVLNTTMFNVSVPDISREFRLTPTEVSWVLTGYIIVFGVGSVIYGKLADIYPIKSLIGGGLILFNIGCLVGFLAQWFPMLVVGRMLQGFGGASMPALSMYVSVRYVPVHMRGRFLGSVSSTIACAGAFGPIVGGFIGGNFHWRYLFLLSLVTLFSIPYFYRLLPQQKRRPGNFDVLGCSLIAAATFFLLVFVTQGLIWSLPAAVCFAVWFVLHIARKPNPFVTPALFKDRRYRNALFTLVLSLATIHGLMFTLPMMLRHVNHVSTQVIGMVIFPSALTAAFLSAGAGRLADRKGSVTVVYVGLSFFLVGYLYLLLLSGASPLIVTFGMVISYSGFSITQSSLARTVSLTLPKDQIGIGMGMYNLFFFIAGAVWAATCSKIIESGHGFLSNPFVPEAARGFGTVFLMYFFMICCAMVIFVRTFRGNALEDPQAASTAATVSDA